MSELDRFETRLRAALVRETAAAPAAFDALAFAHVVAVREPRRRGFRLASPALGLAIPRLAWVLLALAVLTSLVVGTMTVGSWWLHRLAVVSPSPSPALACPAGSTPDRPGPVDQARPPITYAAPMAFDTRAGRIVVLAQAAGEASAETWTFDVCTNTWTRMRPDRAPADPMQLVYDAAADRTITLARGHAWAYDLTIDRWTEGGLLPMRITRQPRLVADPIAGVILVQVSTSEDETQPSELWTYAAGIDTWTQVPQAGAPNVASSHEGLLAYDASADELVGYDRTSAVTRLFGIRVHTWWIGPRVPEIDLGWGASGGEIAYDAALRRTVVFSDDVVIAYDARAATWTTLAGVSWTGGAADALPTGSHARMGHWMVYDPLNGRFVVYGGQARVTDAASPGGVSWVDADDVLAFDPATGRWTVLLEARPLQSLGS